MSNNNEDNDTNDDQFLCLLCSNPSPRMGSTSSLSSPMVNRGIMDKEDRKYFYKMTFLLHKLLQIPLWECTKYVIRTQEDGSTTTNCLRLCQICVQIVEEGRELVESIETLQLKLQTIQATLQNQLLSGQGRGQSQGQEGNHYDKDSSANSFNLNTQRQGQEGQRQSQMRENIRDEIRNNLCRSTLTQRSTFNGGRRGDDQVAESPVAVPQEATNSARGNATSTPQPNRVQMEFEVGEIKTEVGEVEEDPSFGYEVIDLANSDSEEHSNYAEQGHQLDDMVAEVTNGGVIFDNVLSQSQIQPQIRSYSATSSPVHHIDMSPQPGSPQRKRACSSRMEDLGSFHSAQNSASNPQVIVVQQQHQHPAPLPPAYRQQTLHTAPASSLAPRNYTTLLQTLLNTPSAGPPANPPPTTSSLPQVLGKQVVWSGVLEWHERRREGAPFRHPHELPCRVFSTVVNNVPTLNTAGWPPRLMMQCIPKALINAVGPSFLQQAKIILFEFDQPLSPQVTVVTNILDGEYAGCIRFPNALPQCTVKMLTLVHVKSRHAFAGIIPDQQEEFIKKLKHVIQNYNQGSRSRNQTQQQNLTFVQGGVGVSQLQHQPPLQQQQQPGLTIHHLPNLPTSNSVLVTQRQLNLQRIQELQHTLGIAQRTEMNYQIMQLDNNANSTL